MQERGLQQARLDAHGKSLCGLLQVRQVAHHAGLQPGVSHDPGGHTERQSRVCHQETKRTLIVRGLWVGVETEEKRRLAMGEETTVIGNAREPGICDSPHGWTPGAGVAAREEAPTGLRAPTCDTYRGPHRRPHRRLTARCDPCCGEDRFLKTACALPRTHWTWAVWHAARPRSKFGATHARGDPSGTRRD